MKKFYLSVFLTSVESYQRSCILTTNLPISGVFFYSYGDFSPFILFSFALKLLGLQNVSGCFGHKPVLISSEASLSGSVNILATLLAAATKLDSEVF